MIRSVSHQLNTIAEIKKKTTPVFKKYPVNLAILFGSFARGEAQPKSDLDLFIDTDGKLKGLDFVGLLDTLVHTLKIEVDLIDKSHLEPHSFIFKEIEKNGVVIYEKS